jgi:hypothetical protein
MLMVNHALTGAVLGLTIRNPAMLAPAAVLSHFVLDAIPHFGHHESSLKSTRWRITGLVDGLVTALAVTVALLIWPQYTNHIMLGVGFAILPDLFYIPEILLGRRITGWFGRWHSRIQWGENPTGWPVDLAWLTLLLYWLYYHAKLA